MNTNRLLSIIAAVTPLVSWACFCPIPQTLCESMSPEYAPADIGVLGIKLDQVYYGMRFLVLDVAYGDVAMGDTIMVWGAYDGGDGACRVGTEDWAVGDTLFAAFHMSDLAGNIYPGWPPDLEQPGSYMTNSCGTFYFGYDEGIVTGPIAPGVGASPVSDMALYFAGCPTSLDPAKVLEREHAIIIGPFDLPVVAAWFSFTSSPLQLLDMTGAEVCRPIVRARMINLPALPNGHYILRSIDNDPVITPLRIHYNR